jgi:hypothetical protein
VQSDYITIYGCDAGALPFKYLGIPIHYRKFLSKEWNPVEDHFEHKLASRLGKMILYGDRLVLINSVLTSLPMFGLSFFEVPIGVRKRLEVHRSRFFWHGDDQKKKYKLTKGDIICHPKDQGVYESRYWSKK